MEGRQNKASMNFSFNRIAEGIKKNQWRILVFLLIVTLVDMLGRLPYLNIFLNYPYPLNSFAILWISGVILFHLDEQFTFGCAFILLCGSFVLTIFGRTSSAETVGNAVYALLLFGFVQILVDSLRRRRV